MVANKIVKIALAQNMHSDKNDIGDITFYIIIALSVLGSILAVFLCEARQVERSDGTRVVLPQTPTWKSEVIGLVDTLKQDTYILLFFPAFFASNYFYPYQFNTFNLDNFTIRTRSLNNALYWIAEIIGAYIAGYALDSTRIRRSLRAKVATAVLLVLTFALWSGAYRWQKREADAIANTGGKIKEDLADSGYIGPMFLYLAFGLYAAIFQTCLYW